MDTLYDLMKDDLIRSHDIAMAKLTRYHSTLDMIGDIKFHIVNLLSKKRNRIGITNDEVLPIYITAKMGIHNNLTDAMLCAESVRDKFVPAWNILTQENKNGIEVTLNNKNKNTSILIYFDLHGKQKSCEYVDTGETVPVMEWRCVKNND